MNRPPLTNTVLNSRAAAERNVVAGPWGRSREGDVLQVTAVKEKPRRHTRRPRAFRDSSRDQRGVFPLVTTRGLPHGPAAVLALTSDAAPDGFSMPLRSGVRPNPGPMLRKLHTAASVRREAA